MADARELLIMATGNAWTSNEWFGGVGTGRIFRDFPFEELLTLPEGQEYTVWQLAAHLTYYKHMLSNMRGRNLGDFIYPGNNFPRLPAETSRENWNKLLDYMDYIQKEYVQVIRVIDEDLMDTEIEGWGKTWSQVFTFMYSHDIYHISQIRNGWHHLF